MLPDLERLIRLQQLENDATDARRAIDLLPSQLDALEDRLAARTRAVTDAQQQLADHRAARSHLEKDFAAVQSRLSRYKDQIMEVKTNKEYQAMQKEMAAAQEDVARLEDRILERMLEADELTARLKQAEKDSAAERAAVERERAALAEERTALDERLATFAEQRGRLAAEIDRQAYALFETVARQRKGIAVVEARDGHCTCCNVRLRPQVFNDIRSNSTLIQCDSCQRILYFNPDRPSIPTSQ